VYGSCSFARVRTSDVVPGIDTLPSGVVRRTVWALWGLGEHCRGFISVSLPCNTVSKSSILQLLRLFQISQVVRKFSTYFATRPPTRLPRSNCSLAQVSGYLVAGMPERKYVSISTVSTTPILSGYVDPTRCACALPVLIRCNDRQSPESFVLTTQPHIPVAHRQLDRHSFAAVLGTGADPLQLDQSWIFPSSDSGPRAVRGVRPQLDEVGRLLPS
jgi:hypothetical protein